MTVPEINYWAVLLATLSSMIVGAVWYARGVMAPGGRGSRAWISTSPNEVRCGR